MNDGEEGKSPRSARVRIREGCGGIDDDVTEIPR